MFADQMYYKKYLLKKIDLTYDYDFSYWSIMSLVPLAEK